MPSETTNTELNDIEKLEEEIKKRHDEFIFGPQGRWRAVSGGKAGP